MDVSEILKTLPEMSKAALCQRWHECFNKPAPEGIRCCDFKESRHRDCKYDACLPGIQVVDEPPADVLKEMSNREKWRGGTELLGLYSGTFRTKRSYAQVKYASDLIFVFRGPILRCSKGDLPAEVKRVVWHEVAHWLGYETEEQVETLGL
jgi:predicted Zn-dependent protease with MMP-like domain